MNNYNTALETLKAKLGLEHARDKFNEEYPQCPLCKENLEKEEYLWKKFKWGKICQNCCHNSKYFLFLKILKLLENNAKPSTKLRQN